jgi:hypothetical protein
MPNAKVSIDILGETKLNPKQTLEKGKGPGMQKTL